METIIPFIASFFIGGAFCAFFQMIQDHTHSIPPKILLVGIGAGAALSREELRCAGTRA